MKICDKNNIPTFLSVNKVDLMKDDVELKEKLMVLRSVKKESIQYQYIHK